MINAEKERRPEPATARRTEGDRRRRQALADHASGHVPHEGERSGPSGTERFRVVIYLCAAPTTDLSVPRRECVAYAEAFGWEITDVIEDRVGPLPPEGREGLRRTLDALEAKRAGAVLTPWRSMISAVPPEYDEVARAVEKRGGFLQVMDAGRPRARRAERC